VGLVALSINLVVPATVVLLEVDAAKHRGIAKDHLTSSPVLTGLASGLKSPLLWAPILGIAIVLAKVPLPRVIAACFQLIGSTTSGVAVFAVGLVLAAHAFQLSRVVFLGTLGRLTVQNLVLLALLRLLHVNSPFAREALICCSFPLATVVVLFAARYKSSESETASMLLFSTLSLAVTVPIILWLTNHWPV
jgi:predicted permease